MPPYTYKAATHSGNIVEDEIVAEDKTKALQELQKLGYLIFSVKEKTPSYFKKIINLQPTVSLLQKVILFKHLSSMLEAGLTISESIETLSQQMPNKTLQKILLETHANLEKGLSLHHSFSLYPGVFPGIALSMIQVGESSGNLNENLLYLADQMEKTYDTRKKVIGAFIYPAIVLFMTIVLVLFLMTFTMPKIAEILATFKSELPTSTKMLIKLSQIIRNHFLIMISAVIAAIIGLKILLKSAFIRPLIHKIYLELPIFGELFKKSNISLFARTFSSLIQSGIPIVRSLNITAETVTNYHYQKALSSCAHHIEQGGTLAQALEIYKPLFPPIVFKMIAVGEKIGNLDKTSDHLAKLYEKEVEQATKNLSTILEPLLLLIMGITVGGIAVSIISPIYQISSSALG